MNPQVLRVRNGTGMHRNDLQPAFTALLCASLLLAAAALQAKPPHLVIFLSDDHGVIDSAPYGAPDVSTPNMSRLAAEGMLFTRAFVNSPACAPSRAALLTGLYPGRNGAEANHTLPRAELRKLPAYLQELGYEVVAFGKVAHYRTVSEYGFDHFANAGFHDHASIPAALAFLEQRNDDRPLCIFVGSNWPHVPWPVDQTDYQPRDVLLPPTFVDTPETRVERAMYYKAVENMDDELGLIFNAARSKFGDEMLFLHTSDHGLQMPFGKWNLYDAGIRTPLIAVWPGVIEPGSRTHAMVQWIDILPTLVEVGGGDAPADIDGLSFAEVLRGESDVHRSAIYTTHSGDRDFNVYPMRSVRTADWKYIRNLHPEFQFASHINRGSERSGRRYWFSWERAGRSDSEARAIVNRYKQRPAEELYYVKNDRHEQHNLASDPSQVSRLTGMRELLDLWLAHTNDSLSVVGNPLMLGEEATRLP